MSAPTIVISIVAPLNAFLNWLLVWGPEPVRLGFVGAPLATGIGFNTACVRGESPSIRSSLMSRSFCSALISIIYAAFFAPKTAWGGLQVRESFKKLGTVTSLGLAGKCGVTLDQETICQLICRLSSNRNDPDIQRMVGMGSMCISCEFAGASRACDTVNVSGCTPYHPGHFVRCEC